jgi:hypothetical protein
MRIINAVKATKALYEYTGEPGAHIVTVVVDDVPTSFGLDVGDVIELTEEQFESFKDRFKPAKEGAKVTTITSDAVQEVQTLAKSAETAKTETPASPKASAPAPAAGK